MSNEPNLYDAVMRLTSDIGEVKGGITGILTQIAGVNDHIKRVDEKMDKMDDRVIELETQQKAQSNLNHDFKGTMAKLDGRDLLVDKFKVVIDKVDNLEAWRNEHDAVDKGKNKTWEWLLKVGPFIAAVATGVGIHVAFDPPKAIHAQTTSTTSVVAPANTSAAQVVEAAKASQ